MAAGPGQEVGPETLDELCHWPLTAVRNVFSAGDGSDGERLNRFRANVAPGLCVYYSGMAGEHEFMCQLKEALKQFGVANGVTGLQDFVLKHARFCDHGKLQQQVLTRISQLHQCSTCVLSDLNDRLALEAVRLLDSLVPDDKKAAAGAYKNMLTWLLEDRSWVFPENPTSFCVVHNTNCAVFPADCGSAATPGPQDSSSPPAKKRRRSLLTSEPDDSPKPLRVNMAGTTCCGWSSAGKTRQSALTPFGSLKGFAGQS